MLLVYTVTIILNFCGAVLPDSPAIDAGSKVLEMENRLSYNSIPIVGKYPGDVSDIGAWEWFPGVTCSNPKGNWNNTPLSYNPREVVIVPPSNLRIIREN